MNKFRNFVRENRSRCLMAAIILFLGLIYLIVTLTTPFRIPCPIRTATGLACPGCGVTHLITDLARLQLYDAVRQNLAIAVLAPIWAVVLLIRWIRHPKCLQNDGKLYQILTWFTLVLLILFGILRNLPGLEFLLPLYLQ